jgi:hypothetical protein
MDQNHPDRMADLRAAQERAPSRPAPIAGGAGSPVVSPAPPQPVDAGRVGGHVGATTDHRTAEK